MLKLKPGSLVALSTRKDPPGVVYQRADLGEKDLPGGAHEEKWQTTKVVSDPEEFRKAQEIQNKVRSLIRGATVYYPNFGVFICPDEDLPELDAAQTEAAQLVEAFNAEANTVKVQFSLLRGKIADSSKEAIQAVKGELAALLGMLQAAAKAGDVKGLRAAASEAVGLAKALAEDAPATGALAEAVKTARALAREMVEKVKQGAANLEDAVVEQRLAPIAAARAAFLAVDVEELPDCMGDEMGRWMASAEPEPGVHSAAEIEQEHEALGDEPPADPSVLAALRAEAKARLGIPLEEGEEVAFVAPSKVTAEPVEDPLSAEMQLEPEDRSPGALEKMAAAALAFGITQERASAEPSAEALAAAEDLMAKFAGKGGA